jgi:hypothetical protein
MTKPIIKIVNVETGEEIEREMTAEELAVNNVDKSANEAAIAQMEKRAADREALLIKLGITAEEAALLLS